MFGFDEYWELIEIEADKIWSAWFSLGLSKLQTDSSDLAQHCHACFDVHSAFFNSIPSQMAADRRALGVVMEHFGLVGQRGDNLLTIKRDWRKEARQSVDGSDEELLEWASKYAFMRRDLFDGSMDDMEVIRGALRSYADEILDKVLRYLATTL